MPNPLARISAAAGRALSGLRTTSVRRAEGAKFARMSWPAWGSDPAGWWGGNWNTFGSWLFGTLPGSEWNYIADAGDPWLNSCVSACLAFVADNITQPELRVVGPDDKPAKGHPLVALLADPNPDYDADSLWYAVVLSYYVAGNAYIVKARAKNPNKFYLYNLPFWEVYPVGDPAGNRLIDHYLHRVGGRETRIERRDMIHIRHGQDLGNPRIGIAPLLPVLREVATDNTATIYGASVLRNMGIPGVIIQSADPQLAQFDAKARRGLESEWQEKTTGENRGRPIVSSFPLKIDTLNNSPERMALDSLRKYPEARICAAFKLPPQVVGMTVGEEVKSYANYDTADRLAWRNCLVPLGRRLAHALTQQSLVPDFKGRPGLDRVHWDYSKVPAMGEDQDAKAKRVVGLVGGGLLMRSEGRAMLGLESTENDEVYYLPRGATVATGDNLPVAAAPDLTPEDDEDLAGGPDNATLVDSPDAESEDVAEDEKDGGKGGKDDGGAAAKALPPAGAKAGEATDDRGPGVMVGFWLPSEIAASLAIPGGEPAGELHLTLAYLGRAAEIGPDGLDLAAGICEGFAGGNPPLSGSIAGLGRFSASPTSDGKDVIYASADLPGLPGFRQSLVEALESAGLPVSKTHGFTPHVTLAYVEPDSPSPVDRIEPRPVRFDSLVFAAGDDRRSFPLDGPAAKSLGDAPPEGDDRRPFAGPTSGDDDGDEGDDEDEDEGEPLDEHLFRIYDDDGMPAPGLEFLGPAPDGLISGSSASVKYSPDEPRDSHGRWTGGGGGSGGGTASPSKPRKPSSRKPSARRPRKPKAKFGARSRRKNGKGTAKQRKQLADQLRAARKAAKTKAQRRAILTHNRAQRASRNKPGGRTTWTGPKPGGGSGSGGKPGASAPAKPAGGKPAETAKPKPAAPAKPKPAEKPPAKPAPKPAEKPKPAPEKPSKPAPAPAAKPREFTDTAAMDKWGDKAFADWNKSLTPAEKDAVKQYGTNTYGALNGLLRGDSWSKVQADPRTFVPKGMTEKQARQLLADTKSAFGKGTVPEAVVAFRGIKEGSKLGLGDLSQLKVGAVFREKGFSSTSLDKQMGVEFAGPSKFFPSNTVMKITVPKGAKGAYLDAGGHATFKEAKELTLAPNTRYRVTGHSTMPGQFGPVPVLELEVVP